MTLDEVLGCGYKPGGKLSIGDVTDFALEVTFYWCLELGYKLSEDADLVKEVLGEVGEVLGLGELREPAGVQEIRYPGTEFLGDLCSVGRLSGDPTHGLLAVLGGSPTVGDESLPEGTEGSPVALYGWSAGGDGCDPAVPVELAKVPGVLGSVAVPDFAKDPGELFHFVVVAGDDGGEVLEEPYHGAGDVSPLEDPLAGIIGSAVAGEEGISGNLREKVSSRKFPAGLDGKSRFTSA